MEYTVALDAVERDVLDVRSREHARLMVEMFANLEAGSRPSRGLVAQALLAVGIDSLELLMNFYQDLQGLGLSVPEGAEKWLRAAPGPVASIDEALHRVFLGRDYPVVMAESERADWAWAAFGVGMECGGMLPPQRCRSRFWLPSVYERNGGDDLSTLDIGSARGDSVETFRDKALSHARRVVAA